MTLGTPVSTPIKPVVQRLFTLLDEAGLRWAVLRGGDELPERTRYDIDLLVHHAEIDAAEQALERAARETGWKKVTIVDKYRYRCCLLVHQGEPSCFLPVDLAGGCYYRFYPYADSEYALAHRVRTENGFWIVPPGFSAVESLIKELIRHDHYKANSRDSTQSAARADPQSFIEGVRSFIPRSVTERLLKTCIEGLWPEVEALAPAIRRSVRKWSLTSLVGAMEFGWKNVKHHMAPPMSMFVVLLGPDGSGKTTVADLVAERLYHRPFKTCRRFDQTFGLLPQLKRFKRAGLALLRPKITDQLPVLAGTKHSGMNADHAPFRAMAYVGYYAIDLMLGRLLLRRLRGQGALIVFARYFHDYYYQRGYGRAPRWFLKLFEFIVPRPDLIIFLDRDADQIFAVKPELSAGEIVRQQHVIRTLLANRENAHVVDAAPGIEKTVVEVEKLILQHLYPIHDNQ